MKRFVCAVLAVLFSIGCAAAGEVAVPYASRRIANPEDIAAIHRVTEDFRHAVSTKNGKQLSSLMLHSRILFTSPGDQAKVDKIRTMDVNFDGIGVGGFANFVEFITTTPDKVEEKFHNIDIVQDGPAAWVSFDYEFLINNKVTNFGYEHWQLRKTDGVWKIFSVIWTYYPAPKS